MTCNRQDTHILANYQDRTIRMFQLVERGGGGRVFSRDELAKALVEPKVGRVLGGQSVCGGGLGGQNVCGGAGGAECVWGGLGEQNVCVGGWGSRMCGGGGAGGAECVWGGLGEQNVCGLASPCRLARTPAVPLPCVWVPHGRGMQQRGPRLGLLPGPGLGQKGGRRVRRRRMWMF